MNIFSSGAISRALSKIFTPANIGTAIGGLIGLATPWVGDEPLLAAVGRTIGGAIGGRLMAKPTSVQSQTPQFTGTTQAFTQPTIRATTPTTTPTITTPTRAGAVAPTPAAPTTKAAIATPTPAPVPTATPPTPTTAITRTGGAPTPPLTGGYSAPAPAALPPTPVAPGEVTQPTTPENLARYDAMIRALQELAGGAKYVPTPMVGAEPFGPAGALERALRRLREREIRV